MYQARELQELCHVQPQPRLHFSAEEQQAIRERFIKALLQSALALHFPGRMQQATGPPPPALVPTTKEHSLLEHMLQQDMDPYTQMLFHDAAFQDSLKLKRYKFSAQDLSEAEQSYCSKHVAFSEAQAVTMLAETRSQENTKWHRERKVRITGSKCHEYFTFVPKENSSWEEKISAMMADTFRGNDATRYGKESVTQVGFCVHPLLPWLGYSPDGVIFKEGKPAILFEIKSPVSGQEKKAAELAADKKLRYINKDGENLVLNQKQVFLSSSAWDVFIEPEPHTLLILTIPRCDNHIDMLVRKLQSVYFKHLLPKLAASV